MSLVTLDNYYNIAFYNECKEALKNNKIDFKEYISAKPPYQFFLDVPSDPLFVNFDKVSPTYERHLVNIIIPLKPNDDYIYQRRDTYKNKKAIKHYAINDALKTGQDRGQGIFFHATKDQAISISREFPRKLFFMGRYFNRKYNVFFSDSLLIKNYLLNEQILIESDNFNLITELESDLNFKVFKNQDKLIKLSETQSIYNGIVKTYSSVRPDFKDTFILN